MTTFGEVRTLPYAGHRQRVLNTRNSINDIPSPVGPCTFSRASRFKSDKDTFVHRNKENFINRIVHTRGKNDKENLPLKPNKLPSKIKKLEKVEPKNILLEKTLYEIKTEVDMWQKNVMKRKKKKNDNIEIPNKLMEKYLKGVTIPKNPKALKNLLRPKICIDMYIKGIRPLGQLIIELCTEAAPLIVLEFVRLCREKRFDCFQFPRIFPGLWIEGSVKLQEDSLIGGHIDFDKRVLDHSNVGVLSFSLDLLKQSSVMGSINYSISVKPLNVLNGYRVGFGRVVKGLELIQGIQEFGSKNGITSKKIIVTGCRLCKEIS